MNFQLIFLLKQMSRNQLEVYSRNIELFEKLADKRATQSGKEYPVGHYEISYILHRHAFCDDNCSRIYKTFFSGHQLLKSQDPFEAFALNLTMYK
jgi:hypothetical protein